MGTGFSYYYSFRYPTQGVCSLDYTSTMPFKGFRPPPSSLCTFLKISLRLRSGLPSALPVKVPLSLRVYAFQSFPIGRSKQQHCAEVLRVCQFRHPANKIKNFFVVVAGIEPACNQLPFLQGISLRGYTTFSTYKYIFFLRKKQLFRTGFLFFSQLFFLFKNPIRKRGYFHWGFIPQPLSIEIHFYYR